MTQAPIIAPSPDKLVDLRIAHLNMVQGAVTRMAGFSASAKTFCITILAAIIALAVQAGTAKLALGAIVAVICLGFLDLYYLTLELRFRAAYECIAQRPLSEAADLRISPANFSLACLGKAARSLSILLFYIPILLACITAFVYGPTDERKPTEQLSGRAVEGLEGARRIGPADPKSDGSGGTVRDTAAAKRIDPRQPIVPAEINAGRTVWAGQPADTNTTGSRHD